MPASSGSSVEIRVGAAVDPSLEASIADAIAQLAKLTEAEEGANAQRVAGAKQASLQAAATSDQATDKINQANAKLSTSAKQSSNEQVKAWESANREITGAESTLVRDIFSKRQSLGRDLAGVARQMVEQELASDLKYWTESGLLAIEGVGKQKTAQQAGFLQKLIFDQMSVTSTTTNQAAETSAVTTGVAVRTAAQNAGNAEGLALKAATSSLTISQDAAQAAAGAYASASQVPMVGWLLGPVAGAGAYAAVMAYDSITSAAGGQWKVGGDEQITALHRNEMVWPGWAADGARNMLAGFAGGFRVPAGDTVDRSSTMSHQWNYAPTINGVPERNVMDELRNNSSEFLSFVRGLTRGGSMRFG